jgi:hypothetical protein
VLVGTQQIGGESHRHRHLAASHGTGEKHGMWNTLFFHQLDEPLFGLFLSDYLLKCHFLAKVLIETQKYEKSLNISDRHGNFSFWNRLFDFQSMSSTDTAGSI